MKEDEEDEGADADVVEDEDRLRAIACAKPSCCW
jgi:hypothetical protein